MPASINLSTLATRAYAPQPRDPLARGGEHAAHARRAGNRPAAGPAADDDAVHIELSTAARQAISQQSRGTIQRTAAPPQTSTAVSSAIAAQIAGQQSGKPVQLNGAGRREAPLATARDIERRDIAPGTHLDIQI